MYKTVTLCENDIRKLVAEKFNIPVTNIKVKIEHGEFGYYGTIKEAVFVEFREEVKECQRDC